MNFEKDVYAERGMITTPLHPPLDQDRAALALGMTFCALLVELSINVYQGAYHPQALFWLTIAIVSSFSAVSFRLGHPAEQLLRRVFPAVLAVAILIPACILLIRTHNDVPISLSVLVLSALGFLQFANLGARRIPLLVVTVVGFCVVAAVTILSPQRSKDPQIDVFLFQQSAAEALRHGQNPYTTRVPNMYSGNDSAVFENPHRFGAGAIAYGPGVVDKDGWLTYSFPYPPLSLLMVMPAYLLGGDCRFAAIVAMGLSVLLMATARPGRWGALMALLFLVDPKGFFVIDLSWTEPLLVFTFSLAMFCACRWRKGLPWALGLMFATKQYTVIMLPAVFLLMEGPNPLRQLRDLVMKAGLVVAAITLPFFAWNPREFIRNVVQWQFVQPFRTDALSYLVWLYKHNGGHWPPIWTPFLIVIPAILLAIWRCPRSPAGFAAAIAFICLTFFAFNKQAFCNYYYFVIAAACWSVAASWPQKDEGSA